MVPKPSSKEIFLDAQNIGSKNERDRIREMIFKKLCQEDKIKIFLPFLKTSRSWKAKKNLHQAATMT